MNEDAAQAAIQAAGLMGTGANDYGTGAYGPDYSHTGAVSAHNQSEAVQGWWEAADTGQRVIYDVGGQPAAVDTLPYSIGPVNSEQQEDYSLAGKRVRVTTTHNMRPGPVTGGTDLISQTAMAIAQGGAVPASNDDVALAFMLSQGQSY